MTLVVEEYPEESRDTLELELGSLRIASQPQTSRKTVCLWNSTDNDDVEFDCEISSDSLLIVIEINGEYFKVITENSQMGWIHKRNTEVP
jgi:hypothetical protein